MEDLLKRRLLKAAAFLVLVFIIPAVIYAQSLTLEQAYDLARKNYPMIKQKDLVRQTAELSIENLNRGYLPQVTLTAQATYQSAVTAPPVPIPQVLIQIQDRDQYKVMVGDLSQVIYDGGMISSEKELQRLNAAVEDQKVEVELYKLQDRINQIYLGALYLDEQMKQVELMNIDVNNGIKQVQAQVNNGTAFKSNLNVLRAQLLQNQQRLIELKANRTALVDVLSLLINQPLAGDVVLEKPKPQPLVSNDLSRPELKLYSNQSRLALEQQQLVRSKNLPKASFFVQGGYAKPGLNLFKNSYDWYYIGGVRLTWSISGLYTNRREKELATVNNRMVEVQKETFVLNANTQLKQQQSEINKMQQLINTDQAIIDLRNSVKYAAQAQLENGVITSNDFLREVNAEDLARQTLILHQLQLLQAQINYQNILGK
jgi:outer membrane protein TolC